LSSPLVSAALHGLGGNATRNERLLPASAPLENVPETTKLFESPPGRGSAVGWAQVAVTTRTRGHESVTDHTPAIDFENLPTPKDGFLVTHFIIVRNVAKSRAFYSEVLGGEVVLEENPCMVKLSNSWVIMNPGGPPTPDKPEISMVNYEPANDVSTFMNLRVADVQACYELWSSRGAEFLTPPIDRGAEIRCYMRDPDGYLIEVGQNTGLLEGHLAEKRPEDLPG
jgi:catechol 2,3-dioxygenase-like lactoylglutathione lyase family enzyme